MSSWTSVTSFAVYLDSAEGVKAVPCGNKNGADLQRGGLVEGLSFKFYDLERERILNPEMISLGAVFNGKIMLVFRDYRHTRRDGVADLWAQSSALAAKAI